MRRGRLRPWAPRNQRSGNYRGGSRPSSGGSSLPALSQENPGFKERPPQENEMPRVDHDGGRNDK
jgi:hypothetical protein